MEQTSHIKKYCFINNDHISQKIFACCDLATKDCLRSVCKTLHQYGKTYLQLYLYRPLCISAQQEKDIIEKSITTFNSPIIDNLLYNNDSEQFLYDTLKQALTNTTELSTRSFVHILTEHTPPSISCQEDLLFFATTHNNSNAVASLLHNKNLNTNRAKDIYTDFPALYYASQKNYCAIVELLLDHPSTDCNVLYKNYYTPLYTASEHGNLEIVTMLCRRKDCLIEGLDPQGSTPLYIASQSGHYAVAEYLLQRNANKEALFRSFTPLYVAARNGHHKIVTLLLRNGADSNHQDIDGATPLYTAAQNGYYKVIKVLYGHSARLSASFLGGYTPLYVASQNGHDKVVQLLLTYPESECRPNFVCANGATALYTASQNGHDKVIDQLLLVPNIDTSLCYNGNSVLYIAINKGHRSIVQKLLQHSPHLICLNNSHNNSPLHKSVAQGYFSNPITQDLLNIPGIVINSINNNNDTALDIAHYTGNKQIIEVLRQYGAQTFNEINYNNNTQKVQFT
jgi:ankyrin repeat protein